MVDFPEFVEGEPPFDLRFKQHPEVPEEWRGDRITVWMLSTKVAMPDMRYGPYPAYPFYWDGPEDLEWTPSFEYVFGSVRKHGAIHRLWGTQPLKTYIRGHFAVKGIGTYAKHRGTQFVLIQQYFKSGFWGDGNRIVIREQLRQDNVAIPILVEAGIIKDDTPVYFYDQSKPGKEIDGDPFRLFYGKDCLEQYKKWLPEYLRWCRANDFGADIEEVIENYVNPSC